MFIRCPILAAEELALALKMSAFASLVIRDPGCHCSGQKNLFQQGPARGC